jgi:hypothetical protein
MLWDGNQSRMARDLGCTQALISSVIHRRSFPGPKLLSALAQHPMVNVDWLVSGIGQPIKSSRPPAHVCALPVAHRLLDGLVADCPESLSMMSLVVPAPKYRPTRYVFRVDEKQDDLTSSNAVRVGDYLILETDPATWRDQPQAVGGQICVIRSASDEKSALQLVEFRAKGRGSTTPTGSPSHIQRRRKRGLELDDDVGRHQADRGGRASVCERIRPAQRR